MITGSVVLHAAVQADRVYVWAELLADRPRAGARCALFEPAQLQVDRRRRIGDQLRRLIQKTKVRTNLQRDMIVELGGLLEMTEGE